MSSSSVATPGAFTTAYKALKEVSLLVRFLRMTASNRLSLYECPLPPDPEFEKIFTEGPEKELAVLGRQIQTSTEEARAAAVKTTTPQLLKAINELRRRASVGTSPDSFGVWRASKISGQSDALDEAEGAQDDELKRLLDAKRVAQLQVRRQNVINEILQRHTESLSKIRAFLPYEWRTPISRREIERLSLEEVASRIKKLADDIEEAARLNLRRNGGTLLRGWNKICRVIDWPPNEWRGLKKLNQDRRGPIKSLGRGKLPEVREEKLFEWLNSLEPGVITSNPNAVSTEKALGARHPSGKKPGAVFPEIRGHEKLRRSDLGRKRLKRASHVKRHKK